MSKLSPYRNALNAILVIALLGTGVISYILLGYSHVTPSELAWSTYNDPALGISFRYPPAYHVYQSSADYIVLQSDYNDPSNSSATVALRLLHYNTSVAAPTPSSIHAESESYSSVNKDGYQVIHTIDSYGLWEVYILSDKGAFAFADNMDSSSAFSRQLKTTGAYASYRQIFDHVVDTFSTR